MTWWRYRGRSTGRVLHFLYHYVGFDAAERARIGPGTVELRGVQIATFTWSERFGEKDVPEFTFLGEDAARCAENQHSKRETAIADVLPDAPTLAGRKPVDDAALLATMPDAVRSLMLWAQIVRKTNEIDYFVARDRETSWVLWAKAGHGLLYWSREIGDWLRGPTDDEVRG